ncbi:hypothetical protein HYH03_001245 [Edaphochlamys debaryana]|uniref:Uncharacterized protein n=1 Tax=Edaphochlamys debaryana TaxID=47281 RepID=A0A835YEP2_9CHLO|nr:hypothetical protein HYH03_001245 [Edaphochlamys debaryana]|eukprot:KAG2501465.1 hypothetical protein HYH03_001245 [Edaphochlamys debaryana]
MRRVAGQNASMNEPLRPPAPVPAPSTDFTGDAVTEVTVGPGGGPKVARVPSAGAPSEGPNHDSVTASMSAQPDGAEALAASSDAPAESMGEAPMVTLFGRDRTAAAAAARRVQQHAPAASSSNSAESRNSPASSIPQPEVADSPRMRAGPEATASYAASSAASSHPRDSMAESALDDSASFPIPAALPLPPMGVGLTPPPAAAVREPPTFAVPPALKPPDSADSEVMAAWMQGPKLTHLSQSLSRPANDSVRATSDHAGAVVPASRGLPPRAAASTVSGSEASLFSIALDPPSVHASPLPAGPPAMHARGSAGAATTTASVAASTAGPGPGGPPSVDTLSSSKLSEMVNLAMLSGSGESNPSAAPTPVGRSSHGHAHGASGAAWDSYRHSTMAPIAEVESEDGTGAGQSPGASVAVSEARAPATHAARAGVAGSVARSGVRSGSAGASRNASGGGGGGGSTWGSGSGTWVRGSSAKSAAGGQGTGGRSSGGGQVAVGGGAAGGALTALARMGSEGGGAGRPGRLNRPQPAGVPRRGSSAINHAGSSGLTAASTSGRGLGSSTASASALTNGDDGVGASADNFTATAPGPLAPSAAYGYGGCMGGDDDDAVNLASIRPTFIDGPGMEHFKAALRTAGEQADASAAPSPGSAAGAGGMLGSSGGVARVGALGMGAAPGASGQGARSRYGGAAATPNADGADAGAGPSRHAAAYQSYCDGPLGADAPSHEEGDEEEEEEEDSSAIDGPVSSVEQGSSGVAARGRRSGASPAESACSSAHTPNSANAASGPRASAAAAPHPGPTSTYDPHGDGEVVVTASVCMPMPGHDAHKSAGHLTYDACALEHGAPEASEGTALLGAEASASAVSASASGLSGCNEGSYVQYGDGGGEAGCESTADSVAVSQHRQKHWVNWMANQSVMSVGMSDAGSSRVMRSGMGRPGPSRSRVDPAAASTATSVNQRAAPAAVPEEEEVFVRWG